MKILVTGGAGYVGSTLVPALLSAGHKVRVLDCLLYGGSAMLGVWSHPDFEFQLGDIRDRETVKKAVSKIDAVVHLAAIVGDPACARQPDAARKVNLDASLMLLEECELAGVQRFVFASTCSNYGKMADPDKYVDEGSDLTPVSIYAKSKVAVEEAMLSTNGKMCKTPLRFATVFGVSPRMRFDLTVNEFTRDMLTKKHLVVFGEQFWRPYIHVSDVARAIELVLSSPIEEVNKEVFNVGSTSENYQKQQLVELILPYVPDAKIEFIHKDEDPRDYRVSFAKINEKLGFDVTLKVRDGIKEVARLIEHKMIADLDSSSYRN